MLPLNKPHTDIIQGTERGTIYFTSQVCSPFVDTFHERRTHDRICYRCISCRTLQSHFAYKILCKKVCTISGIEIVKKNRSGTCCDRKGSR